MSARLELLEGLVYYDDWRTEREATVAAEADAGAVNIATRRVPLTGLYPTHVPLWANEWKNPSERMGMAAAWAADCGWIEYHDVGHPNGPMLRITDAGRIALKKLRGELPQDHAGRGEP